MKIQQHDGVVVDATVTAAGLHRSSARGRGVAEGEGGAKSIGASSLPLPSLYRPPRGGGAGPRRWDLLGGGGQGGGVPPKASGAPPTPTLGFQP